MKKLMLASAATLSIAAVSHATIDTVNKSGFYIGLNSGYTFGKSKMEIGVNKSHTSMKGPIGGAHFGFQHDFGKIIAGIEFASDFTRHNSKTIRYNQNALETVPAVGLNAGAVVDIERTYPKAITTKTKLSGRNDFTVTLRAGLKVAPCWVAGLSLGYANDTYFGKTSINTIKRDPGYAGVADPLNAANILGAVPPSTTLSFVSKKYKFTQNGFIPGVYVEKLLEKHVMVGLAYNYGIFKQKKKEVLGMDIKHKPQVHDIKLRLGYKF